MNIYKYNIKSVFFILALSLTLSLLFPMIGIAKIPDMIPHVPVEVDTQGKNCAFCHLFNSNSSALLLPVKKKNIAKLLEKRTVKFPSHIAFQTYEQSVHGRLRELGDPKAPYCNDCHLSNEWSKILPVEDPNSPIHENNIAATCSKCHGKDMIEARVSEGSMHVQTFGRSIFSFRIPSYEYGLPPQKTKKEESYYIGPVDILGLANWFYIFLITSLVSFFIVYVIFDYKKRRQNKIQQI